MRYIEALKGWKGYKKSELIKGKYRPIFGKIRIYRSKKVKDNDRYVRVPATRENIRKQLLFNYRYGAESYRKRALMSAKRRKMRLSDVI